MSQESDTDDTDISDKVDQLEVELNRKIAGLDQRITRLDQNIARINRDIATAARARDEAEQAALKRKVNEASSNAETPPATQASPGLFGWFKSTPTGA
jgi:septal ring factor EnvC (AmiA/AmiB activator)